MAEEGAHPRAPVTVSVDLGPRSYDILIGRGLLANVGAEIATRLPGVRARLSPTRTSRGCTCRS